ncbi:MAG: ATP-binding cassette domain-containing protein, partial [Candidatus Heimdallarchaeota archaeon]
MTRLAIVNKHKCNPKKCNHECSKFCPVNRTGKECVVITDKSFIDEKLCTGCGICPKKCPFRAISIINLPEALKEKPIYRYGENEFELFRLPIPREGKVVGIVGANGIGKTTALELLSDMIQPNFGSFNADVHHKDIVEFFRGNELQKYF